MLTIEHEFDHTKITVLDEGETDHVFDDITIKAFEDHIRLEQYDPDENRSHSVIISIAQLKQVITALNLPEGSYLTN